MLKHKAKTEWLILGFLDAGSIALIFGESGTHKSFLAIDIGLSVATGKDWHGFDIKKSAPVLYIAGEGFSGIYKRLKAWKKVNMTTNDSDIPFFTSSMPMDILNEESTLTVKKEIEKVSLDIGMPALVVIDTLARNFGPGDENSTADMSKFISSLDRHIKAPFKCCILIIHHSGLKERDRSWGSSALRAALDWEYKVEKKRNCEFSKIQKRRIMTHHLIFRFHPKLYLL
jgi:RecA-family ATPase